MSTENTILQMRGITKLFPGVKALQDVTLTIVRGEVHAICGENGAGKSTLMNVLSGVYPHGSYEGDILFEDELCDFKTIRDSEHRGIVIIHQELALSPFLSIAENIVLGKQQLVEIAKALSKRVKLLILDEPTAALNDEDSSHLLDLVRSLKGQGITSIIISHKLNEIAAIADRTTVIRDGKTIETLDMHGAEPITEQRIIRPMVGRSLDDRFPDREPNIGAEVLRIEDWTVHHPIDQGRKVVDGASISVHEGEVIGLAGLMGAGRTEFAMSVFGRTYGVNASGKVFKDGQEIHTRTVQEAISHGIVYATEDRKRYGLNLIEDIKRNISAAALGKLSRRGVVDREEEVLVAERY